MLRSLNFLTIALDHALVLLELLLIGLVLRGFLTLHVIANQRARRQSRAAADGRAHAGTTEGAADQAACGRTADRADAGAFFPRGHRSAGASGRGQSRESEGASTVTFYFSSCLLFSLFLVRYAWSAVEQRMCHAAGAVQLVEFAVRRSSGALARRVNITRQ